ncbi:uncharacterized protein LOC131008350 [Salvia miltiorrhiza]|uniref:uncharacterized protein LOC131008350 n=1 Tax=Salvia miltiorrhiza TaxID=226208 RepID=UPI0025ABE5A7|nr:uncharacterized protein LOC131008350 [Salvia miltiorrhiza]
MAEVDGTASAVAPAKASYAAIMGPMQVSEFQYALIGRVILRKGEKPLPNIILKQELHKVWHIQNDWQLIPMGNGFFILKFSNVVDKDQLLVECWHPKIIAGIDRHIGLPLKIETAFANGIFGHFARILVEVDLGLSLPETLLINCDEGSFYVEFSYEKLPLYCSRCKITGHSLDKCKRSEVQDKKQPKKKRPAQVEGEGKAVKKVENAKQWHVVRGEQAAAAVVGHATDMPGERNSLAILAKEKDSDMEHPKPAEEVGGISDIEQQRQALGTVFDGNLMLGSDLLDAVFALVNDDPDLVNAESGI